MLKDISVIIPCFNRVNLLKQTVRSAEAAIQNLNAEVILVDDGSDVPIEDQLQEFRHLPLKFLRQPNSGLTVSRYNGMLAAQGEYIQFLDSDDQIDATKLTEQIAAMRQSNADVSHTDVVVKALNTKSGELETEEVVRFPHTEDVGEFYIGVQPAPHSPVFRREYLQNCLKKAFIPLSRDYDSIGEVWFYYNLSVFDAKIIKIDKPLTIAVRHTEERLTNHWERLGLCSLNLQANFLKHYPTTSANGSARKFVSRAAFRTYRGLPNGMYKPFQFAFLRVWKLAGKTKDVGAGRYFNFLSKFIGHRNAAIFFKGLGKSNYQHIKTIDQEELVRKTNSILQLLR